MHEGQSGAPVLYRDDPRKSIGTHIGALVDIWARPIAGQYGNPYDAYRQALTENLAVIQRVNGFDYISVPLSPQQESLTSALTSTSNLHTNISHSIWRRNSPFLGMIGSPVTAVAGGVLAYAGMLVESTAGGRGSMSLIPNPSGLMERALLAEATLRVVYEMEYTVYETHLKDHMEEAYLKMAPGIFKVGDQLLPLLMGPALHIAFDAGGKAMAAKDKLQKGETESAHRPVTKALQYRKSRLSAADSETEIFPKRASRTYGCPQGRGEVL